MQKYSIFYAYPLAFFSKDIYRDVGRNWRGICFFYLSLLLLLTNIPLSIQVHMKMAEFAKNEAPKITSQFPPISIRNGEVSIIAAQPHYIKALDSNKIAAILDTTGEYTNLKNSDALVLLTKHELITRTSNNRVESYDLSDVRKFDLDKKGSKDG